jgi:hypothetical protein
MLLGDICGKHLEVPNFHYLTPYDATLAFSEVQFKPTASLGFKSYYPFNLLDKSCCLKGDKYG